MDLVLDEFASYSPEERATYLRYVQQARRGTIPGTGSVRTFRAPSVRRDFQAKLNTARGVSVDDGCNVGLEFTLLPDASPRQSSIRSDETDGWSGFVEEEEDNEIETAMVESSEEPEDMSGLESGSIDDTFIEPKIEITDEDVSMDGLAEVDAESLNISDENKELPRPKRPRGRPRKHPIQTAETQKIQKGRSKTGCLTCRKRKKKCDETKPTCNNCAKNNVHCGGYLERQYWRSGKERREEAALLQRVSLPNKPLAPIIHGVVTSGDRIFFEHYIFRLSAVLTVEGRGKNAFKDILLPMATQHLGLMHSILAMSSSHIDFADPYGRSLIAKYPDVTERSVIERAEWHKSEASALLAASVKRRIQGESRPEDRDPRIGQMVCLIVQNLAEGEHDGKHRGHLQGYMALMKDDPPEDSEFKDFVEEYFQFHIGLDDLISLPKDDKSAPGLGALSDDWELPNVMDEPEAVRLLGVHDRLFFYMSKITAIRNQIRRNMEAGVEPVVDYTSLYRAAEIDAGIRDWQPSWPQGDPSRDLACQLYKQMMWVYLWRTIYPPKTTTWQPEYKITLVVNDALELLKLFPPSDPVQTLLLAPTFIIGCAAFEERQRPCIRESIRRVREYTRLKNADRALDVLERVWSYMDAKDGRSWDWQRVAFEMGMDFLAT